MNDVIRKYGNLNPDELFRRVEDSGNPLAIMIARHFQSLDMMLDTKEDEICSAVVENIEMEYRLRILNRIMDLVTCPSVSLDNLMEYFQHEFIEELLVLVEEHLRKNIAQSMYSEEKIRFC